MLWHQGFLQARFFLGGGLPPPPKKISYSPQNFYWLYFLPLAGLDYSPPQKSFNSPPKGEILQEILDMISHIRLWNWWHCRSR